MPINNSLPNQQGKKQKPNDSDFKRYIKGCLEDLKSQGYTYCHTYEQVEALKNSFDGVLRWCFAPSNTFRVEVVKL